MKLKQDEDDFYKHHKHDLREKYTDLKSRYENELAALKEELKEKTKENKRLNEAFKSIKQSNETLKSQVILIFLLKTFSELKMYNLSIKVKR
jgi:hypothetical protein